MVQTLKTQFNKNDFTFKTKSYMCVCVCEILSYMFKQVVILIHFQYLQ